MSQTKYDIAKQFTAGFVAAIAMTEARSLSESDHWIVGWDAGYLYRGEKTTLLNEYLVSIGRDPIRKVHLAEPKS